MDISNKKINNNWNYFKIFYHAARFSNFTLTGKYLKTHQSSVSRLIMKLEKSLGYTLFLRHKKGITLTEEGQRWFYLIEKIYFEIEVKSIVNKNSNTQGPLVISTTQTFLDSFLIYYVPDFLKKYPDTELNIIGSNSLLKSGDADVAILPLEKNRPGYIQSLLIKGEFNLFASHSYLQAYGTPQTVRDLKHHRLIVLREDDFILHQQIIQWFLSLGQEPGQFHKPYLTISSPRGLIELAEQGCGIICFCGTWPLGQQSKLVRVLPHLKGQEVPYVYMYAEKQDRMEKIETFKAFWKDIIRQNTHQAA